MYLFILLAVIFSTFLFVLFTLFKIWNVDTFQAIVFNYLGAAVLALLFNFKVNLSQIHLIDELLLPACFIGFLFIAVFFVMALTTQTAGLAVASVATKMSLMIPVIFGILHFKESLTIDKLLGIFLALIAIVFSNYGKGNPDSRQHSKLIFFLPLILFLGAGTVDTSIKFAQVYVIPEKGRELFIMLLFGAAFATGSIKLLFDMVGRKRSLDRRSFLSGMLLGIPNFFSIYFLLKALEIPGAESSIVFSISNLSIVVLATVSGFWFFKQRLSKINIMGIVIAMLAIVLLSNVIGLGEIKL